MRITHYKAARMLGYASIAVGATELLATRWLQNQLGVRNQKDIIRSFGAREVANGVMILGQPGTNRALVCSLWTRVAGDIVDLIALGNVRDKMWYKPDSLNWITNLVWAITGLDLLVSLWNRAILGRRKTISRAAKIRVQRTNAKPSRAQSQMPAMTSTTREAFSVAVE